MDDQEVSPRLQQVDVVDDLRPPAVHVQDRLADQVLVHQEEARLVDEGRVPVAFGRLHENRVVVDLDHPVPRDELGRLAPAEFHVEAERLGIRIGHPEHEVRQAAEAAADLAGADGPLHQLREEVRLVVN